MLTVFQHPLMLLFPPYRTGPSMWGLTAFKSRLFARSTSLNRHSCLERTNAHYDSNLPWTGLGSYNPKVWEYLRLPQREPNAPKLGVWWEAFTFSRVKPPLLLIFLPVLTAGEFFRNWYPSSSFICARSMSWGAFPAERNFGSFVSGEASSEWGVMP